MPTLAANVSVAGSFRDRGAALPEPANTPAGPWSEEDATAFREELEESFAATAPTGWQNKNIEVVLATAVTDNVAGPRCVVAVHYSH